MSVFLHLPLNVLTVEYSFPKSCSLFCVLVTSADNTWGGAGTGMLGGFGSVVVVAVHLM